MCYEIDTVDIWWTLRKILWAFQYIICKEDRPRHTAAVRPQAGRNPCFNGHHSVTAFSHWAIHLASIEIIQLPHSVTGPFTLLQLTSFSYRIQALGHSPCFNWHHSVTAFSHWAIHKNVLRHFGTFKATQTTNFKKHATVTPEGYTKLCNNWKNTYWSIRLERREK